MTHRLRIRPLAAGFALCALALMPLGCGSDGSGNQNDEQALRDALRGFGQYTVVRLNTAGLARAVQAGRPITLPFARQTGAVVEREVQLTLRNLRNPQLTEFVLKDGDAGSGSSMPLPAPATYQGTVRGRGAAAFTITAAAVEGTMLVAPDGWSFIEPLEPQLRLHDVDPDVRRRLLRKYNHIVYNTKKTVPDQFPADDLGRSPVVVGPPQPPVPLVMSVVADGDAALWRAYPLDSVMPFWLKQETLFNGLDWLYNCVEPDANAANAYSDCDNEFDGGSGAFQARVRIDRLEVWTSGGPTGATRSQVLAQSTEMTHQSSPLCCGLPHTAGRSNLVFFFSGTDFTDGAGEAFGIGGLNYYGPDCEEDIGTGLCHHGVSQLVASKGTNFTFHGTAFEQLALTAHEIGHINNANDIQSFEEVCWLFDKQCGQSLMFTQNGFNGEMLFLYVPHVAETEMGPLMAEELEPAADTP
jgi:hypothetical protein